MKPHLSSDQLSAKAKSQPRNSDVGVTGQNPGEFAVPRAADQPAKAAASLARGGSRTPATKELHGSLDAALKILDDPWFDRFPLDVQAAAVTAVNSPDADERLYEKADRLAEACETWNFHNTALRLWAGIGRARHAANPDAPLEQVYAMGYDERTPAELLQRIHDESGGSVHSVAGNPNAPSEVLEEMAGSEMSWLREKVAQNPSAPAGTLNTLSADPEWRVRWGVTQNPHASSEVIRELCKDSMEMVSEAAKKASRAAK